MVSLLIPLVLAPAAIETPPAREPDPPVQVWLSSNGEFERGDRARVYVRAEQDGYLLVMHADADGRVRVLFPLDPGQDEFVRGGENLEIRGRGDRDAFLIDERTGTGTVLAAWSPDPFHFADVTLTDHWDYRAIAPNGVGNDAEAGLLDLADHFAAGQRYYYDVAEYIVGAPPVRSSSAVYVSLGGGYCYSCWSFGWSTWNPGFYFGISFGSPWRYRPIWYDPWYSWGSGWYDSYYWYRPVFRHVWNPYGYYWRWPTRRYPRYGVHIRYADGCWGSPFCNRWDPHRGRPGRATGVGFGHDSWRYAYGLTEPRETPGLGIGRVAHQVSDVRGTQPRRFGDGLSTSPDRMRTAVQSRGGATDTRATNGIARSSDVRDRSAQVRAAGTTETGRFEARRNNGISGAVRNGQAGQAASGRSSGIRSSVETSRGIARARENAVQPRQESSRANAGIRASDGGRPAMTGSGTARSSSSRSWILEIPPRGSRGSASERSTGSTTSRSSGIRSSVPRSSAGSGTTGNVRSQSTQIIRSGPPRTTTESRSSSGIRSSIPRSSAGSGTTGNIRSRSTQIIRSGPPRTTTESRSSSGIRSRASSSAVPRSSSPPARSSSGVRSSAPPVRSGSGAIRSRVSQPSRSAPPRSSSSRASSSSGRTSSIRGSAMRSSSSAGSARIRSSARSSGSSSRSSASASRGSSSRGSASASRGSSSRGSASASRGSSSRGSASASRRSSSRSGGSRGVASARRKN